MSNPFGIPPVSGAVAGNIPILAIGGLTDGGTSLAAINAAIGAAQVSIAALQAAMAGALAAAANLSDLANAGTARTNLGLGSAAVKNVGASALDVVQLDASAKLPAVDGSQLTGLTAGAVSAVTNGNGLTLTGGTLAFSGAGYDASGAAAAVNAALTTALASYLLLAGGTLADGANIVLGVGTGTQIGTDPSQRLGFLGAAPTQQGSPSGNTTVSNPGGSSPVLYDTSFPGLNGTAAYTIGDIVTWLKAFGLLETDSA
jgi:hypothetical protein